MNEKNSERLSRIEEVLKEALPENIENFRLEDCFAALPEGAEAEHAAELVCPCADLMRRGGKRWRPLLLVLACGLAGGSEAAAYPLTPIVELIHTASLIHDDIEDNADKRRGGKAVHLKYGLDTAVNAGSWLYFYALNVIGLTGMDASVKSGLYGVCIENLNRLHLGQAMDISWHKNSAFIPSRAEYGAMIRLKTGSLSRLAGELGFIAAGKSRREAGAFGALMAETGAAFQILDDVKNIEKGNAGKRRGDDIVEGKKSFPVILYLEKNPAAAGEIAELFKKAQSEGINSPAVDKCIRLMENSGVQEQAQGIAQGIIRQTLEKIDAQYSENGNTEQLHNLFSFLMGEN